MPARRGGSGAAGACSELLLMSCCDVHSRPPPLVMGSMEHARSVASSIVMRLAASLARAFIALASLSIEALSPTSRFALLRDADNRFLFGVPMFLYFGTAIIVVPQSFNVHSAAVETVDCRPLPIDGVD